MSRVVRATGSVLALVSLVTAVSLCGVGSGAVGVHSAQADVLPLTTSFTGSTFTATFAGDDSGLSFAVDTDPLDPFPTTGGGWISTLTGGKSSFGFIGGIHTDLTAFGHVVYVDHSTGFRMVSTSITSFTPGCTSTSLGIGDSSSGPLEFQITVRDNAEPGTNDDIFIINSNDATGSTVYAWGGTLQGGDIQAHGLTCP